MRASVFAVLIVAFFIGSAFADPEGPFHVETLGIPSSAVATLSWAKHRIGQALGVEKDDEKAVVVKVEKKRKGHKEVEARRIEKVVHVVQAAPAAAGPAPAPAQAPAPAPSPAGPIPTPEEVQAAVRDKLTNAKNPDDTMSEEALDGAEVTFDDLDCIKKDGNVTISEAATWGTTSGIPWSEIKPLFNVVDTNHDNILTEDEFEAGKPYDQTLIEDFRAGFRDIDLDDNGLISKAEWNAWCEGWMSPRPSPEVCNDLFKVSDTHAPKGEIDHKEFEDGGKECESVDDGDCSKLIQTKTGRAGGLRMQHNSRTSLAVWFTAHLRHTAKPSVLFSMLMRRHKQRKIRS